jgi:peroxiredoxin
MKFQSAIALCLGILMSFGSLFAAAVPGKSAPAFTLKDVDGGQHSLQDFSGKWVVLEWVNFDCPFVKKHYRSGNMPKLQSQWKEKGVVWLAINSSAKDKQGYFETADLKKRIAGEKADPSAYLLDTDGKVGKLYGAKTTPHLFVIDPEGKLVYAGAIDDKPSTDPEDIASARNYLNSALQDAMDGKAVEPAATKPYGCSVKY